MVFSIGIWQKISPIYQEILDLPFNSELADGTLNIDRFTFYMEQDSYYLIEFSKVLALIASRSKTIAMIHQFLEFSLNALLAERSLHAFFIKKDEIDIEISPACIAYTRSLIATAATASLEEAVAAVLPCFWIYREVGQYISKKAKKNNPYSAWINTYSSEEFSLAVDQAIAIMDDLAKSSLNRVLMTQAFEESTLFEWHFWNDAYNMSTFRDLAQKNLAFR